MSQNHYEQSVMNSKLHDKLAREFDDENACICCVPKSQDNLLNSSRKRFSKQLIQEYRPTHSSDQSSEVFKATSVMISLYTNEDKKILMEFMNKCRLNPNLDPNNKQRDDLQYYIPQLINYLVFHDELNNQELINFIIQASQVDFFFAHLVYFQLRSLSEIVFSKQTVKLEGVIKFLEEFVSTMTQVYTNMFLIAQKLLKETIKFEGVVSILNIFNQQKGIDQDVTKGYHQEINQGYQTIEAIQSYGTLEFDKPNFEASVQDIKLNNYISIYKHPTSSIRNEEDFSKILQEQELGFQSTIDFWEDLIQISQRLKLADPKIIALKADVQLMNSRLPAAVYVPFLQESIRNFVILNIVPEECRVFSTKERSPFYICLEIFRPEDEKEEDKFQEFQHQFQIMSRISYSDRRISDPRTLIVIWKGIVFQTVQVLRHLRRMLLNQLYHYNKIASYVQKLQQYIKIQVQKQTNQLQMIKEDSNINSELDSKGQSFDSFNEERLAQCYQKNELEIVVQNKHSSPEEYLSFSQQSQVSSDKFASLTSKNFFQNQNQDIYDTHQEQTKNNFKASIILDLEQLNFNTKSMTPEEHESLSTHLFGESSEEQQKRIRSKSPFRKLKTWRLVHIIVKSGDNLKQEQFAMQLISQMNQIFQMENLSLKLTTYEVLSLGPSYGIIQMIKDATTIDSLKKNLKNQTLKEFFHCYYDNKIREALMNFLESLAAYSLVCYFLQVKDRHNGNILLHKDGYIIHIDFGFFLSNSPGKGIEFEKKVPFKLLSEYIDILGGVDSGLFQRFRRYFYEGFKSIRKHQDKILLLVKMMYSGHGSTMPCFKKGMIKLITLINKENLPLQNWKIDFSPIAMMPNYTLNVRSIIQNKKLILSLINQSIDNWRARWYDKYQYYVQGIFY